MTVAVVGAGLAGLSAGWELNHAGADVVVLDAGRQLGGMIVTERRDGFIVEGGPDGFLAAEPDIQELAREVGIGERLVDQVARGATVWTGRRLEPLPVGRAAEVLGIQGRWDVGAQHAAPLHGGFTTFTTGMADVVEALVTCLGPRLRTTQGVTAVAPSARGWRLSFTGGSSLDAEGVILAVPAWVAARLLAGLGVSAARSLDTVVYAPSVTVSEVPEPGAGRLCPATRVPRTRGRRSRRDRARRARRHPGYREGAGLEPRLPLAAGAAALSSRARRAGGGGPGAARPTRAPRDRGSRLRWCGGVGVREVGAGGGETGA